jgi:hypothetical protein
MAIKSGETTYHQAKRGIVQNGLVLNLDAAVDASYSGGTTWRDLEGGNNGTLTNGPTFDAGNGGSIVFDGSDDYVDCGNPSISTGKLTTSAWVKINTTKFQHVLDSSSNSWHLAILDSNRPYLYNGSTYGGGAQVLSNLTWYMITGVQGTTLDMYVNGVLSQSVASNVNVSTNTLHIGRWQNGGRNLDGDIASAQIYNRALTATEVLQNYNVTRHRFGV